MTAIVNSAAGLGWVVNGAEILPFRGLHFGARLRRAGWVLREKCNDQVVDFHGEEAAQFVEPQGPVHAFRGFCKLHGNVVVDRGNGVRAFGAGKVVMKRFEVFLELERGVKLLACHDNNLVRLPYTAVASVSGLTCARGINGGPAAISRALLPGLTRLVAPTSSPLSSSGANPSCSASESPTEEEGPIWTSVSGGGLGNRGEVAAAIMYRIKRENIERQREKGDRKQKERKVKKRTTETSAAGREMKLELTRFGSRINHRHASRPCDRISPKP